MPKYFEKKQSFKNGKVYIENENFHHLKNVLRIRVGQTVEVTDIDSKTTFNCLVENILDKQIVLKVLNEIESKENFVKIFLFQALPKLDKMEFIVEKAVELGVYEIIPLKLKYNVSKIDGKEDKKINKWNNVALSAAKQSRRDIIPQVQRQMTIYDKGFEEKVQSLDYLLVLNENEEKQNLRDELGEIKNQITELKEKNCIEKDVKIGIIVGAEGGISKEEVEHLLSKGAKSVSLGKRILRCETAPIVMLSILNYECEEI